MKLLFPKLLAVGWLLLGCGSLFAAETALDRYIAQPDPAYTYRLIKTVEVKGAKAHIIDMTSQSWLTTNEVDRPIWTHRMTIIHPPQVKSSKSLLMITGGRNSSEPSEKPDDMLIQAALLTGSVVTELKMVPNQPLTFKGDGEPRVEDSLIAFTWDKFIRTGDEKWPARLPMTKSAVRAMDTVVDFCSKAEGGNLKIDGFVIAGGSKRGWTTWTTACVDKRVIGIIPIVIDMLNIMPSFIHHYEAYGFWAPAVGDYVAMGIMDRFHTQKYQDLMKIEEPYQYLERLKMPKFMINASGDQFFLPDSSQFYFHKLPGVKYQRYVPNGDHSLNGTDAVESLISNYGAIIYNKPLPTIDWRVKGNGSYNVTSSKRPKSAKLWQASNPTARDFRVDTIGKVWTSTDFALTDDNRWVGTVPTPEKGWKAFFVELTFDDRPVPFKTTTDVQVIPDILPFKGKTPNADLLKKFTL